MVCITLGLILCYNTIDLLITNNKPIELMRETKEAWPSVVSLTTLFLHSLTPVHSVSSLVCCCTGVRLEAPRFWQCRKVEEARFLLVTVHYGTALGRMRCLCPYTGTSLVPYRKLPTTVIMNTESSPASPYHTLVSRNSTGLPGPKTYTFKYMSVNQSGVVGLAQAQCEWRQMREMW